MNLEAILRGVGWALAAYLLLGAVATIILHARGLARLDPATRGGTLGFRLLVTPGMLALWPLLFARWRTLRKGTTCSPCPPGEAGVDTPRRLRSAHGFAWKGLAVAVPLAVGAALVYRPSEPIASSLPARLPVPSAAPTPR